MTALLKTQSSSQAPPATPSHSTAPPGASSGNPAVASRGLGPNKTLPSSPFLLKAAQQAALASWEQQQQHERTGSAALTPQQLQQQRQREQSLHGLHVAVPDQGAGVANTGKEEEEEEEGEEEQEDYKTTVFGFELGACVAGAGLRAVGGVWIVRVEGREVRAG